MKITTVTEKQIKYVADLACAFSLPDLAFLAEGTYGVDLNTLDAGISDAWPDRAKIRQRAALLTSSEISRVIDGLKSMRKSLYIHNHPQKFQGQLWEPCKCGNEPVNMPTHLCADCLMRNEDHQRIGSGSEPEFYIEPDGAR